MAVESSGATIVTGAVVATAATLTESAVFVESEAIVESVTSFTRLATTGTDPSRLLIRGERSAAVSSTFFFSARETETVDS